MNTLASFQINEKHDGIEIYFSRIPCERVRQILKQNKYKFHFVKKCWYTKRSKQSLAIAEQLADISA